MADSKPSRDKAGVIRSMLDESGGTTEALNERSVLHFAASIRASGLILNGALDDSTDPAQARRLADSINRHGCHARAIIYPEFGHKIPVEARSKDVDAFIDDVLGGN